MIHRQHNEPYQEFMNVIKWLFLFFIFHATSLIAQDWGWTIDSDYSSEAKSVAYDASGNSYVCGHVTANCHFSSSIQVSNIQGGSDVYISKYNPAGMLLWVKHLTGNGFDRATDIAIGPDNSPVVSGTFTNQLQADNSTINAQNNSQDIFVLKITDSGQTLWLKQEGGLGPEIANGITVDQQNNVLITGNFTGSSILQGQSYTSLIDPFTNLSSSDMFVSKYTANGNPTWIKIGASTKNDKGSAVAVNSQQQVFVCGQFSSNFTFANTAISNVNNNVGFLAKLDNAGSFLFLETMKAGSVLPNDLSIGMDNQVVICGDFSSTMTYSNPGNSISSTYSDRIFIIKTNDSGVFQWSKTFGSSNPLSVKSLAINPSNGIFITGFFNCSFDELRNLPGNHDGMWNSVGFGDVYTIALNASGTLNWSKQAGSQKDDLGQGIAAYGNLNPVFVGYHSEQLFFPSSLTVNVLAAQEATALSYESSTNNFELYSSVKSGFVTNCLAADNYDLNYFIQNDSILGAVNEGLDTVVFCAAGDLDYSEYNQTANPNFNPLYTYNWSNALSTPTITVNSSGWYWVEMERLDQCSGMLDSIYVDIHANPPLPLYSDTMNLFVDEPGEFYADYLCLPHNLVFNFQNLCQGCTLDVVPNVTGSGLGPYEASQSGTYFVNVMQDGCGQTGIINLDIASPSPTLPPMVPAIMPGFDTIYVCGNIVTFFLTDSLTNPQFILSQSFESPFEVYSAEWVINGVNSVLYNSYAVGATVTSPQWFQVSASFSVGYLGNCDTVLNNYFVSDSFYVVPFTVSIPPPVLLGNSSLCPGDSTILSAVNPQAGFQWNLSTAPLNGQGIIWQSQDGDSIAVDAGGVYQFEGSFIDPISGCPYSSGSSIYVEFVDIPTITMNPIDALLCPGDSIFMGVQSTFASYTWIGPNGQLPNTTPSIYGTQDGNYYCVAIDSSGCQLTSPNVQIIPYVSPTIQVIPSNILCGNNTIEIMAIYSGNPTVNWWPTASNSNTIQVTQPGFYGVTIEQCNILTSDTVEIIDGSFQAAISAADTMLCYAESAVLTGSLLNANYEWLPTNTSATNQLSVNTPGDYSAIVTNAYGCQSTSNTIHIGAYVENIPPPTFTDTICIHDSLVLSDNSGFPLNWYNMDTSILSSGSNLMLNDIQQTTTFLASYVSPECPNVYSASTIFIYDSLSSDVLSGPSVWCNNGLLTLHFNQEMDTWFEWFNGDSIHTDIQVNAPGTYSIQYGRCAEQRSDSLLISDGSIQYSLQASDTLLCTSGESGDPSIQLQFSPSDLSIQWNVPFNAAHPDFLAIYAPGLYIVQASNSLGCSISDSIEIIGVDCTPIIPNVVTPNGDGINDIFLIENALNQPNNHLIILNRWGNLMYESAPYLNNFSPSEFLDGTYFYIYYPNVKTNPGTFEQGFFAVFSSK
jgi:gliding motility-associated-like protein